MADITVPQVDGVITSDEVQATVDGIAEWQLPNGMVPWFPGGHADPWNHVEAAMALALGGRISEAERAYDWLVGLQRPDGAWHQYYVEDGIEDDKFDANVVAYVAAGVWHHWLLTEDRGFAETLWPVVEKAIDFVWISSSPAARSSGPATPMAPRGPSPCSPARRRSATRCAAPSPSLSCSATNAPTGSSRPPSWPMSSATRRPTPSPPSTAGRWTGTTRCWAARSWARPARPAWPTASTRSSTTAAACAA